MSRPEFENLVRDNILRSNQGSTSKLTERQALRLENYVADDHHDDKTYARRLVEDKLSKLKWYNPNYDPDDPALNLSKGWAFYEHFTLARQSAETTQSRNQFKHVDPGIEKESKLYGFFTTPSRAFSEWGIGVALYFQSLKMFSMALLVACIISIRNIAFYQSVDYHGKDHDILYKYYGSAICESYEYVTCEESYCNMEEMGRNNIPYWISRELDEVTVFVRKNVCNITGSTIMNSYITILFLLTFTLFFGWYQKKLAVRLDEDLITASDYSIHVQNPPEDAHDPSEWRDFFRKYDEETEHVVGCTIVLNNEALIWQLINRRICRDELQKLLPKTDIDNKDDVKVAVAEHIVERNQRRFSCLGILFSLTLKPILNLINRFVPAEKLLEKIDMYSNNIRELQGKPYHVADVFITFETESGQRNCLEKLNEGKLNVKSNESIDPIHLFRGETHLDVVEPTEPSAVRYQDLSISGMSKNIRFAITFIITVGLIGCSSLLVNHTRKTLGVIRAGLLTSFLNIIIPRIVNLLLLIEKHNSEGGRQRSLFLKVTLFRWGITVIMTRFLTDYTATLSSRGQDGLLPAVFGIFIAEISLVPVLRYVDLGGLLSKHYFAPRATTQNQMYLCFKGSPYNLAERYTDLTKIVFLSFYYCALYPFTLLFGGVALILRYYVDKFCLLRTWRSAPYFGTQLADFSMKYFIWLAIVLGALVSAFDFVYFPFDHVCDATNDQDAAIYENIAVTNVTANGEEVEGNLTMAGGSFARVCSENTCCQENVVFRKLGFFKPWRIEGDNFQWMSDEQGGTAIVYAVTAFSLLMGYIAIHFGVNFKLFVKSLMGGLSVEQSKVQNVDYSSIKNLDGYIPQITIGRFPFPLLLCDVKDITPGAIGWIDPSDETYRDNNCIFDIDDVNAELDEDNNPLPPPSLQGPLFSVVKQWERDFSNTAHIS